MEKPSFDPGLTQQYTGTLTRAINKDGQFNVRRRGVSWRDVHPYLYLVNASWGEFAGIVVLSFVLANLLFAALYLAIGIQHLHGADGSSAGFKFLNAFFFSVHTFTTVGYGNIWPSGPLANAIASLEALVGLMTFAIATGLLFGRFSRPSVRIGFSRTMVIAPYKGGSSLQFRIVNRRTNNLIELEARLLLMVVELVEGRLARRYIPLELERDQVLFFPLTWTIVHPIDEASPLYGKTAEDLKALQAEILILLKGFDDTSSQTVHARTSYRYDEIEWGARFRPAFEIDAGGEMLLAVDQVGTIEPVEVEIR